MLQDIIQLGWRVKIGQNHTGEFFAYTTDLGENDKLHRGFGPTLDEAINQLHQNITK